MQNGSLHICSHSVILTDVLRCVDLNSSIADIAQSITYEQNMGVKVLKLPVLSQHVGSLARDGWVCCSQTLILLLPAADLVVLSQAAKLFVPQKKEKQARKDLREKKKYRYIRYAE